MITSKVLCRVLALVVVLGSTGLALADRYDDDVTVTVAKDGYKPRVSKNDSTTVEFQVICSDDGKLWDTTYKAANAKDASVWVRLLTAKIDMKKAFKVTGTRMSRTIEATTLMEKKP